MPMHPPQVAIPPLRKYFRLADRAMLPIMFILRGFKFDSLQQTHPWHNHKIDPAAIEPRLGVTITGTDPSRFTADGSFFFHAPIMGGWKNYSVYQVAANNLPFHIGWIVRDSRTGQLRDSAIQRLPISGSCIRMLDGPPIHKTVFFALTADGRQIPLRRIAHGRLGDGRFLSVRLF